MANTEETIPISSAEYKRVTEEMYKQNLELARLYKQVDGLNHDLQVANDGQANLIHIINHQIKGYLGKARNIFSELVSEPDYGPIPEAAKPMIAEGFNSMTEGVTFVKDFLDASNIEKGTYVYSMQSVDIKSVVEKVTEEQKKLAEEKGLTFELKIGEGDYKTKGDESQLSQAVKNLIDNSIKYTPQGGLTVNLTRITDKIIFSVSDTGVGFGADLKPKLFTKGGRSADSIKININSTGFGLSFVKGVVEAHKGQVSAESAGLGKGATFSIELPVVS